MEEFLYQKLYRDLLREIQSGTRRTGDLLPPEVQLAAQYGVSRITSRHAIQMLEQQGYVERVAGRGTRIRQPAEKRKTIGLALSSFGNMFGMDLVKGIFHEADLRNYYVLMQTGYNDDVGEGKKIHALMEANVAGMIHVPLYDSVKDTTALREAASQMPVVFADREISGQDIPLVCTDNVAATETLCRKLRDYGHQQVAFVSGNVNSSTVGERYKGFVRYFETVGIPCERKNIFTGVRSVLPGMDCTDMAQEDIRQLMEFLTKNYDVTAIIAHTYKVAQLVTEAIHRLGFRVPDDYSVVCFDAPYKTGESEPFAHMRQDEFSMGRRAVQRLDELIHGNVVPSVTFINAEYIHGASCGPAR